VSFSSDRRNSGIAGRHDHVGLERHQLPGELGESFGRALGEADLEENCFPFDVAELPQPLLECGEQVRAIDT